MKKIFVIIFCMTFMFFILYLEGCSRCNPNENKPPKEIETPIEDVNFEVEVITNKKIRIGKYIGPNDSNKLIIPSQINGKKVVEISDAAFANDFMGEYNITEVFIPKTIEKIGKEAFKNCVKLEKIEFEPNYTLKTIDKEAFYGCTNITNIVLPRGVVELGDGCFSHCSNLTNIVLYECLLRLGEGCFSYCSNLANISLPKSIKVLSDNCFAYCHKLTGKIFLPRDLNEFGIHVFLETDVNDIAISKENKCFVAKDQTLYDKKEQKIIFSLAKGDFIVPYSVIEICEYAFFNNQRIRSIDLQSVINIRNNAFSGCKHLSYIFGGARLKYVNKQAFFGTKWLQNRESENIILGKALIQYKSEENSVYTIPSDICYIGEYAFESKNLKDIRISKDVSTIGDYAFSNCPNLTIVYMLPGTPPPTIYGNSFSNKDKLKIYVPYTEFNTYKNHYLYEKYIDNLFLKEVLVEFCDGPMLYKTIKMNYGSILQDIPSPVKEGYSFKGWKYEETGKIYINGYRLDLYEDLIKLTAVFEPIK